MSDSDKISYADIVEAVRWLEEHQRSTLRDIYRIPMHPGWAEILKEEEMNDMRYDPLWIWAVVIVLFILIACGGASVIWILAQ